MVADKVTVETLKRGTETSFKWESDMSGSYTVSDGERDFPGTYNQAFPWTHNYTMFSSCT